MKERKQSVTMHVRLPFTTANRIRMLATERGQTIGELLSDLVDGELHLPMRKPKISDPVKLNGKQVSWVDILADATDSASVRLVPHLREDDVPGFIEVASRLGQLNPRTGLYHLSIQAVPKVLEHLQGEGIAVTLSSPVKECLRKGETNERPGDFACPT